MGALPAERDSSAATCSRGSTAPEVCSECPFERMGVRDRGRYRPRSRTSVGRKSLSGETLRCEASARTRAWVRTRAAAPYLGRPLRRPFTPDTGTYALRQEAQAPQDRHAQAEEAASQEPPQEEEPLGSRLAPRRQADCSGQAAPQGGGGLVLYVRAAVAVGRGRSRSAAAERPSCRGRARRGAAPGRLVSLRFPTVALR